MTTQVNQQSAAVARMAGDWAVIDALMGGTPAMRAAGKTLLPQQPRESDNDYKYRKDTATLFPAYERTVTVMAGKPFSKPLTPGEDIPLEIVSLLPNIDKQGASLHSFCAGGFSELVGYGFGGILVDHTKSEGAARNQAGVVTKADEKSISARPYWTLYRHDQILGLRYSTTPSGQVLSQVRLLETIQVPDGEFGEKDVQQVRVLEPGRWAIYRSNDGQSWAVHEEGETTLAHVPFIPLLAKSKGQAEGQAPLRDLAYLNVKHWQKQSDQDDSVRYASKPIPYITGMTDRDTITVAANSIMLLPANTTAGVLQGQAEAVTVGRSELEALESQMIQTGAELLVATPGQRTATEASNDAEANKSSLQRMAEDFEDAIDLALQYTADWLKLPTGGAISLFKDYAAATLSDASAQLVVTMGQAGQITKETVLKEMQRRGVLSPDMDVATEVSMAAESVPALGTMGAE